MTNLPSKSIIGSNLRRMRKQRRKSQSFVADELRMSSSYLCYLERGERNPTVDKLDILANYYGIETVKLFEEVE